MKCCAKILTVLITYSSIAQPFTCSNPFEINLCPTASFINHSVKKGINTFNTWTIIVPIIFNGAEMVYKVNFPTGTTQITVTVSGMTDNSVDGMGGPAVLFLKGETCTNTNTYQSFQLFNQTVTTTRNYNVSSLSSPVYFIMDHAESTPIQYNISFTASGYSSLPGWCATPLEIFDCYINSDTKSIHWSINNSNKPYKVTLQYAINEHENFYDDLQSLNNHSYGFLSYKHVHAAYLRLKFESEFGTLYSKIFTIKSENFMINFESSKIRLSNLKPDETYNIKIYSLSNTVIFEKLFYGFDNYYSIDCYLPAGFYILTVRNENQQENTFLYKKFIIIR